MSTFFFRTIGGTLDHVVEDRSSIRVVGWRYHTLGCFRSLGRTDGRNISAYGRFISVSSYSSFALVNIESVSLF